MKHWLLKTEPETFSFERLIKDKRTNWNGVRNFQARNHLRNAAEGDLALIYHSGDDRQVVGVAEITRGAYPDPDPKKKGDWVQIDIKPVKALKHPVTLSTIKETKSLSGMPLLKQSRLSVMPISSKEFETILKMGAEA